jgi:hypothetical protein
LDRAVALERWLHSVETAFVGRVLGIDNAVSDQWGRIGAIRSVPVIDSLLIGCKGDADHAWLDSRAASTAW